MKIIAKVNNRNINKCIKDILRMNTFNDFRYSVNYSKLSKLGWKPSVKVEDKIFEINDWYIKNLKRYSKRF